MSSCRTPLTTSNGSRPIVDGSSWLKSGTALIRSVSMMPHVSTSVNRSPTMMLLRSVFQKQRIGSVSTSPGLRVCVNAFGGCATAGVASERSTNKVSRFITVLYAIREPKGSPSLKLPQLPPPGEFDQRRFHFPSVESHAHDVEVVVACQCGHVRLPLVDSRLHARQLATRDDTRRAGLDVERLDPSGRRGRQAI